MPSRLNRWTPYRSWSGQKQRVADAVLLEAVASLRGLQSVDEEQEGAPAEDALFPLHAFDPFHFQSTEVTWPHKFLRDRRYWYRYTEWAEREEVLITFSSVRELYWLATVG